MEDIEVCYKNTSTGENVNLFWDEVPSSSLEEDLSSRQVTPPDHRVEENIDDSQCQRLDGVLKARQEMVMNHIYN